MTTSNWIPIEVDVQSNLIPSLVEPYRSPFEKMSTDSWSPLKVQSRSN